MVILRVSVRSLGRRTAAAASLSCGSRHGSRHNVHPPVARRISSAASIRRNYKSFVFLKNASLRWNSSIPGSGEGSLATQPFLSLVEALKEAKQTCTIIESSCGGLISSSLMSVPGSSKVFFGSTTAYSTKRSGPLLCGDAGLHARLLSGESSLSSLPAGNNIDIDIPQHLSEETKQYINSKINWTRETALSFCHHMQTDYAIAEGGATGPTFHPKGMASGFAVLAIAGRKQRGVDGSGSGGDIEILAQKVVHSPHDGDCRELNMRLYADEAAELCLEAMGATTAMSPSDPKKPKVSNSGAGGAHDLVLDRSSHLRSDDATMKEYNQRKDAQHVIVRGTGEVLFASSTQLALPSMDELLEGALLHAVDVDKHLQNRTFLGRLGANKIPVFALLLPESAGIIGNSGFYFAGTRPHAPFLLPLHNELALTATAYANWRDTNRFCPVSGSPLEYIDGGTCAKSLSTGSDGKPHLHWPRQDPSIITLVTNPSGSHALLARSPRHPVYLYTALAGFLEPGETFESAVCREVYEEVGVRIQGSIEYIASQPWPFPRSCMIGMTARTTELSQISIDEEEIVDARWFEKSVVRQAARDTDDLGAVMDPKVVKEKREGRLLVPPRGVLARTLIDHWLET